MYLHHFRVAVVVAGIGVAFVVTVVTAVIVDFFVAVVAAVAVLVGHIVSTAGGGDAVDVAGHAVTS